MESACALLRNVMEITGVRVCAWRLPSNEQTYYTSVNPLFLIVGVKNFFSFILFIILNEDFLQYFAVVYERVCSNSSVYFN